MTRCPTCRRAYKRSNEQNAFYWALLGTIAERLRPNGQAYVSDSWHEYFKDRLLPKREVRLPNGKVKVLTPTTTELDVDQFADYVTKIEAFAAERNVYMADREAA